MAVNKVVYGTTVLVDLTGDTVTADKLMQGYTAHDKSGALITGIATGGSGDAYTLTTIVPQQTFTAQVLDNSYQVLLTYTAGLEDGESYLVTFDGEEYFCECGVMWNTDYMAGTISYMWEKNSTDVYPFGLDYVPLSNEFAVGVPDQNQHTIKVEHLEFVDGPLNLISKSVTANGTYNASSDNADGYSSVTVNVPSGSSDPDIPTFTTDASETVVTCDKTYAQCLALIQGGDRRAFADIGGTIQGTVTAHTLQGTTGETLRYYYIHDGVPSAVVAYEIDGTLTLTHAPDTVQSLSVTENGTYNASGNVWNQVTVNVPSGSSMNVQTAQSTTRATSSTYTNLVSLTCSKAGTYDVYWDCFRSSTSGSNGSQLRIGGSTYGSANTTFSNHAQTNHLTGVTIAANQEVAVYARSRGSGYYAYCGQLTIVQTA